MTNPISIIFRKLDHAFGDFSPGARAIAFAGLTSAPYFLSILFFAACSECFSDRANLGVVGGLTLFGIVASFPIQATAYQLFQYGAESPFPFLIAVITGGLPWIFIGSLISNQRHRTIGVGLLLVYVVLNICNILFGYALGPSYS